MASALAANHCKQLEHLNISGVYWYIMMLVVLIGTLWCSKRTGSGCRGCLGQGACCWTLCRAAVPGCQRYCAAFVTVRNDLVVDVQQMVLVRMELWR